MKNMIVNSAIKAYLLQEVVLPEMLHRHMHNDSGSAILQPEIKITEKVKPPDFITIIKLIYFFL